MLGLVPLQGRNEMTNNNYFVSLIAPEIEIHWNKIFIYCSIPHLHEIKKQTMLGLMPLQGRNEMTNYNYFVSLLAPEIEIHWNEIFIYRSILILKNTYIKI